MSFSGLISHFGDTRDALHVAWRAKNAKLLAKLRVEADRKPTPAQLLAEKQAQAVRQQKQQQKQQKKQQRQQERQKEQQRQQTQQKEQQRQQERPKEQQRQQERQKEQQRQQERQKEQQRQQERQKEQQTQREQLRVKMLAQEQATFDKLEAEVRAALQQLRSADEDARKAAVAQFRAWIPAQISAAGRYCSSNCTYLIQPRSVEMPTLSELKRGGFGGAECSRSGYSIKDIRKAGYTAAELCAHRHEEDRAAATFLGINPTERRAFPPITALLGPKAERGSQSEWTADDGYYTWSEVAAATAVAGFTEAVLLEVLDNLLVTQLRSALESRGLNSDGLKKDLVARMLQPERAESAKRKASELALHEEEQMQDVQAAGLADEVAGLRARLAEETQARQRAEMAQEEMRAAKRARIAQSDREAAAVAWRDAAGSTGAMEIVDSAGFMARFLAFRQARSRHLLAPSAPSGTAPASERAAAPYCHACTHHAACIRHTAPLAEILHPPACSMSNSCWRCCRARRPRPSRGG